MSIPTAEQILTVLNDGEPVDYSTLTWCVISGYYPSSQRDNYWPFEEGELLILGESGREPFGEGRKPGKWDVAKFECRDYEQALALSKLIKDGAERGLWHWADGTWQRTAGTAKSDWPADENTVWVGKGLTDQEREAGWVQ